MCSVASQDPLPLNDGGGGLASDFISRTWRRMGEGVYEVVFKSPPRAGSSAVFAVAVDLRDRSRVALKVIPARSTSNAQGSSRWLEESRVHRDISTRPHPNITQLLESRVLPGGDVCLVMDYAEGGDLLDHIPTGRGLPYATVLALGRQLVAGLAHLHALGYVHRDIKCENCVLSKGRTHLRIIDFGSACLATDRRAPSPSAGTRPYMAPERLNRPEKQLHTQINPQASDVFSAGVVFFCMLTGRLPWGEAHPRDVRYNMFSTTLSLPLAQKDCTGTRLPVAFYQLLHRMMDPDVEFRCSAREAHEELVLLEKQLACETAEHTEMGGT